MYKCEDLEKMSQKHSTINFVIHDANGQPQVVKVVKNLNSQPLAQIKIKPNPVKLVQLPVTADSKKPLQTVKLSSINCDSKLVQVPAETFAKFHQVIPKTEPQETEEIYYKRQLEELDLIESVSDYITTSSGDPVTSTSTSHEKTSFSNMSHPTRRRHDSDNDNTSTEYTTKRRKLADKVGKGLRHFSMKVCEKVRTKGFTSYNEVADELVLEFASGVHGSAESQQYDQKNIRRRVYDALNVLMAMNIISKDKKEIRWLGLPTNSIQECTTLEKEKQSKLEQIEKKSQQLQELILQHISFKSLIERNKEAENRGIKPSASSAIHLPFIVVNTSDKALIDCSISNDKTEYMFNFNKRFQIHDDIDILKRMGLLYGLDKGKCTEEDIARIKSMVPKSLESYVEQMGKGVNISKISSILAEEEMDESFEDEEHLEVTEEDVAPEEDQEAEANEYSDDDSSDVDV